MNQEHFIQKVMRALPELDQEEKTFPNIKKLFQGEIARMHAEGWNVPDAIQYCRLNESIDCWVQKDGIWHLKDTEDMLPEDIALARSAALISKYRKTWE